VTTFCSIFSSNSSEPLFHDTSTAHPPQLGGRRSPTDYRIWDTVKAVLKDIPDKGSISPKDVRTLCAEALGVTGSQGFTDGLDDRKDLIDGFILTLMNGDQLQPVFYRESYLPPGDAKPN